MGGHSMAGLNVGIPNPLLHIALNAATAPVGAGLRSIATQALTLMRSPTAQLVIIISRWR
jgi:hypothetical protein